MNISTVANSIEIKNQNITDIWNDPDKEVLEWGFLALPNTLLLLHHILGITNRELIFIIKIHALNNLGKINILDKQITGYNFNDLSDETMSEIKQIVLHLNITQKSKEYKRVRRGLEKKGYLKTTLAKAKYNIETGRFVGQGVEYDFTGLIIAIKKVKKIIKENRQNKETENQKNDKSENKENTKTETTNSKEFKNFLKDYSLLHEELLYIAINFNVQKKYKEYLKPIFEDIENKKADYKKIFEQTKTAFNKLPDKNRTSLKLQDTLKVTVSKYKNIKKISSIQIQNGNEIMKKYNKEKGD